MLHNYPVNITIKYKCKITKQEIVFKKDKATLHVISKRCEDSKLFRRRSADVTLVY